MPLWSSADRSSAPTTPGATTSTSASGSSHHDQYTDSHWLNVAHYEEAVSGFALYDPEEWLPTLSFDVSSSFMRTPFVSLLLITVGLTVWAEMGGHMDYVSMPLDAHVMLGGALSFLVVMRTDASMKKWQEAREAWQRVFNCVSNLGAQTAPLLKDDASTELFLMQLMAFGMTLKAYLRDEKVTREECGPRMDWQIIRVLNSSVCPPLKCLGDISKTVRQSVPEDGKLSAAIWDEVSEQIRVINHAVGTMHTIKSTPMTKGYVTTLRSFLILWLSTLPLAMIGKYGWGAGPVLLFIAYLFLSVEKMAVEIEQPFGDDTNDLPQEQYIMQLEEALLEDLPGFEPELEEDIEDERARGQLPSLPVGLPPGRYYMDVPANAPPGYAPDWKFHQQPQPGRGQPPQGQPLRRQQSPSRQTSAPAPMPPTEWREQFRARMSYSYPPGGQPAALM